MTTLNDRLEQIESKISQADFRDKTGNANEVSYFVFDYAPSAEREVTDYIKKLEKRINNRHKEYCIKVFDLYDIIMEYFEKEGYLEGCFDIEGEEGLQGLEEAMNSAIQITDEGDNNYLVKNTPDNAIIFLTGVGKCFPIFRSHNILNILHQKFNKVPVILMFPGCYDGQHFMPFGSIKGENYYRAFRLI